GVEVVEHVPGGDPRPEVVPRAPSGWRRRRFQRGMIQFQAFGRRLHHPRIDRTVELLELPRFAGTERQTFRVYDHFERCRAVKAEEPAETAARRRPQTPTPP